MHMARDSHLGNRAGRRGALIITKLSALGASDVKMYTYMDWLTISLYNTDISVRKPRCAACVACIVRLRIVKRCDGDPGYSNYDAVDDCHPSRSFIRH